MDGEIWDYNCPQYVDFCQPQPLDDGADTWFDTWADDKDVDINQQATFMKSEPSEHEQPSPSQLDRISQELKPSSTLPVSSDKQQVSSDKQQVSSNTKSVSAPKYTSSMAPVNTPKNLRTDISTFIKPGIKVENNGKPTKIVKPLHRTNSLNHSKSGAMSKTESTLVRSGEVANKENKRMPMKKVSSASDLRTHHESQTRKRPHTRGYSGELPAKQNKPVARSNTCASRPPAKIMKITVPNTPSFMTRSMVSSTKKAMTGEERELEEIASFKQQLAMKRKKAQESLKQVKMSASYKPTESQLKPTVPVEFSFKTDSRLKKPKHESDAEERNPADFTKTLRANTSECEQTAPKGLTKTQPFKLLTTTRKRSSSISEETSEKFVPVAEKIRAFQSKTPDRFRKVPKKYEQKKFEPRVTVPFTPNLQTRSRTRGIKVPTRLELEEKEVEEMKKNQFRAHDVNTHILQHPNIGVPKVLVKPPTELKEFNLHPGKRKVEQDETVEEKHEFHAKPIPAKILEQTVGVKPAKVIPITVPQSPAFALKNRVRLPIKIPDEETSMTSIKCHPVPHVGIPFQPKISHNYTVPEPFTFEGRNKYIQQKKEEKVRQFFEEEKKAKEFHAQPIPWMDSPVGLPDKRVKSSTKPEPFQLKVDIRGAKKAEEWRQQVEEELNQQRSMANFHARPAAVLKKEPFIPERSTRPLVEINEFELNTDRRAVEREQFEQHKKAREAELEAGYRQQERRKEEEERAAVAKLRSEMTHKANPIKKYCPVEVRESGKPLTQPMSPRFSERLKSKVHT